MLLLNTNDNVGKLQININNYPKAGLQRSKQPILRMLSVS